MSKNRGLHSGQPASKSGQYRKIGPRGGKGPEVTGVAGKPLPPTSKPGSSFRPVDPTRHRGHRG